MVDQQQPAGWYPDPTGRFEVRWFDGRWTDQVATAGLPGTDPTPMHLPTNKAGLRTRSESAQNFSSNAFSRGRAAALVAIGRGQALISVILEPRADVVSAEQRVSNPC